MKPIDPWGKIVKKTQEDYVEQLHDGKYEVEWIEDKGQGWKR